MRVCGLSETCSLQGLIDGMGLWNPHLILSSISNMSALSALLFLLAPFSKSDIMTALCAWFFPLTQFSSSSTMAPLCVSFFQMAPFFFQLHHAALSACFFLWILSLPVPSWQHYEHGTFHWFLSLAVPLLQNSVNVLSPGSFLFQLHHDSTVCLILSPGFLLYQIHDDSNLHMHFPFIFLFRSSIMAELCTWFSSWFFFL